MIFYKIDWAPNEVFFKLGPIAIHWYSLMFIVAFTLGYYIIKRIYQNENKPVELVEPLFIYVIFGTLIGARLGEVFFYNWDYFQNNLIEIFLPIKKDPNESLLFGTISGFKFVGFRGLASHGATIGIISAMFLYKYKFKFDSVLWIFDRIVIPISIGGMFVRIGNFFNSEIVGDYTGNNFGIIFANRGEIYPRHPAQLYEAMGYLILFIVYYKKIRFKFSDILTNTFSTVVVVFLYVQGAQKIYNQNSFLLNLESNNTTAGISSDLNIHWILNGFSKVPNLIFSPSLGLIWSAPVIIIGIVTLFLNKNYLKKFNILSKVFIFLYLFGAFLVLFVWQGREGSFGQRLLIGVIPFCAYQLCIFLNNKKKDFLVPLIIVAFVGHLFLYSTSDLTLKTGLTLWNTQNEWAAESYYLNLFYEIFIVIT